MHPRSRALILVAAATIFVACSGDAGPSPTPQAPEPSPSAAAGEPFAIRTAAAPPQACMDALISGKLVQHPASGLGIGIAGSPALPVEWPFHWTARVEAGRVVLVDETGMTVAREGDDVQMGGGQGALPGLNAIWFTCGGLTVTRAAS
jgi:hypothetical protein